jgi:hypothetical protein
MFGSMTLPLPLLTAPLTQIWGRFGLEGLRRRGGVTYTTCPTDDHLKISQTLRPEPDLAQRYEDN